jgi:hypothetical protein
MTLHTPSMRVFVVWFVLPVFAVIATLRRMRASTLLGSPFWRTSYSSSVILRRLDDRRRSDGE